MLQQIAYTLALLSLCNAHITPCTWQDMHHKISIACARITSYSKNKYTELRKHAIHSSMRPYSYILTNDAIDEISNSIDNAKTKAECKQITQQLEQYQQDFSRCAKIKRTLHASLFQSILPKILLPAGSIGAALELTHQIKFPLTYALAFSYSSSLIATNVRVVSLEEKEKNIARRVATASAQAQLKENKLLQAEQTWWQRIFC